MKKVELEELIVQLKQDIDRLEKEANNYKKNSQQLELGKSMANIIQYTLNETEVQMDIYGSVIDALRDFHQEKKNSGDLCEYEH